MDGGSILVQAHENAFNNTTTCQIPKINSRYVLNTFNGFKIRNGWCGGVDLVFAPFEVNFYDEASLNMPVHG